VITLIAEAGLEHCGNVSYAYKLVDEAKGAGADIVKFQTYDIDKLMRAEDPDRWQLARLSLDRRHFVDLAKYAEHLNIEFMSTPGDVDSLKFLVEECGVKRIKIGSDDLTFTPLLSVAKSSGLPVILSTGMATMSDIRVALEWLDPQLTTLLHCVSSYPTNPEDANLLAMKQLRNFGLPVGYSDHTETITACIAAAALGAEMIEKHLTLDYRYRGPDSIVALDPVSFKYMVSSIRDVEKMLGSGLKEPCEAEKANIARFRKDRDGFRGLLS